MYFYRKTFFSEQNLHKHTKSKCFCFRIFSILLKYNYNTNHLVFAFYYVEEYRQRGRFAGFALFVSNNGDIKGSILCYKDGPELPPLNFTTTCTEYGRYVIFYNERMDEVVYPDSYQLTNVYTELCEVIVKGKLYILHHGSFLLRYFLILCYVNKAYIYILNVEVLI